jgi:hypothetical protein
MKIEGALCRLRESVFKKFCATFRHYPRLVTSNPNIPFGLDTNRLEQDFQGIFHNPEDDYITKDARNNHIKSQGNMAYIDTDACNGISFKKGDCIKLCVNDGIYTVDNIKLFEGNLIRLELKQGGKI